MKKLKSYSYDPDIRNAVEIGDLEFTDKEYEKLEIIAKSWNMAIPDAIRIIISNGLKAEEFRI